MRTLILSIIAAAVAIVPAPAAASGAGPLPQAHRRPVEEAHRFLTERPVARENCSGGTCIYRNVGLADCQRLGGLPYARPFDKGYSGVCAIRANGDGLPPDDISLHRAPRYTGEGPANAWQSAPAYPEVKGASPAGRSGISGSPTQRGGGSGSGGGTGSAR